MWEKQKATHVCHKPAGRHLHVAPAAGRSRGNIIPQASEMGLA